jgi:O-antigen/teichoic acid export membrane protein
VRRLTSRERPKTASFTVNLLQTFATLGLARATQIAIGILTARFLGPHDRGLYSLLWMIPQTLEVLLRLGIGPANVYMICREKAKPSYIVSNSALLALGLGSVALLALPFRDLLGQAILANVNGWYLTLAVSVVPFWLLSTYLTSILHGLNQFQTANQQTIISVASRLFATFIILVVLQRGLFEVFLVNVLISVLAAIWLLVRVCTLTSASFRPHLQVALETLTFGVKSHGHTLLSALHVRLDHFLIALFLGPSQVAFYAIARHIAELIGGIHGPISTVLYPRLASGSEPHIHDTTITVCRHVLFLESLVGIVLILASQPMIGLLYGRDYLPVTQPLFILVPGVLMLSLFNLLARNFTSRNKQQTNIVAGGVGLVVNVILNIVLIPRVGISGAALASTVSYSLAAVILAISFSRHSRIPLREFIRVRQSDLTLYKKLIARFVAGPAPA